MAAGGGLGGGGIYVPVFFLVAGLEGHEAIPLSQVAILGGSLANLANYVPKIHPKIPERSLIDYGAVLLFTPMLLIGTTIGVILNEMFPDWLRIILLVLLLLYTIQRTAKKARKSVLPGMASSLLLFLPVVCPSFCDPADVLNLAAVVDASPDPME